MVKTRYARTFLTAVLMLFGIALVTLPSTAHAQAQSDRGGQSVQGGAQSLPSWAEPQDARTSKDSSPIEDDLTPTAPPPPDDPSRVPVDGGLSLLALAGAGYATKKLRDRSAAKDKDA